MTVELTAENPDFFLQLGRRVVKILQRQLATWLFSSELPIYKGCRVDPWDLELLPVARGGVMWVVIL